MGQIQDQISAAAISYGLDPAFALAVAQTESGFQQSAMSPAGAIGVFQLMPNTAAGLGVDPTNLTQNIDGGVRYLKQLLDQYGGNQALALAGYNAGPGNVAKYNGIPPFAETQSYINKVLSKVGDWLGYGYTIQPTTDNLVSNVGTADYSQSSLLDSGSSDTASTLLIATGIGLTIFFVGRVFK